MSSCKPILITYGTDGVSGYKVIIHYGVSDNSVFQTGLTIDTAKTFAQELSSHHQVPLLGPCGHDAYERWACIIEAGFHALGFSNGK